MLQPKNKHGFTLIEAIVSVAIAALVIIVVSNMLTSAMHMSRRGSGHLTNLLAADIVMQQLLADLKLARKINSDDSSLARGEIELERISNYEDQATPGLTTISYSPSPDGTGLIRNEKSAAPHQLFRDRLISLSFKRVKVPPQNRSGLIVELKVSSPPESSEMHVFKRFVYLESLPHNRALVNSYSEL